jgi:hypothetical protein
MLVPCCISLHRALAGDAGCVSAVPIVRALAGPLARARRMKMEAPATCSSQRTDKTIGRGGRSQWKLMAAMHIRGVSLFLQVAVHRVPLCF